MTKKKRRSEKTEKKMAKARREGELKAEVERESKVFKGKKDTLVWFKGLVERMVDKIDPIKLIAMLGTTVIVKDVIEKTEPLAMKISDMYTGKEGVAAFGLGLFGVGGLLSVVAYLFKQEDPDTSMMDTIPFEAFEWAVSFGIAYVIIEHGGTLLGLLGDSMGNLSSIVGLMMGA